MIRHYPDPVLLNPSATISVFNDDLKTIAKNLFQILKISRGVGLAAPQIGIPLRIAVIETPVTPVAESGLVDHLVLVNPTIIEKVGSVYSEEGCLSLPGVSAVIERAKEVTVEAQDLEGNTFRRTATALLSAAIQHETDHLSGVMFFDHLGPVKRDLLLNKYRKTLKRFHRRRL